MWICFQWKEGYSSDVGRTTDQDESTVMQLKEFSQPESMLVVTSGEMVNRPWSVTVVS